MSSSTTRSGLSPPVAHADSQSTSSAGRVRPAPWYASDESMYRSLITTRPVGQRRPDHGGHVVGPVGGVEQRLGPGRDAPTVGSWSSSSVADPGADLGRARLAGHHDVAAVGRAAACGEQPDLGRLAGALAALEHDERARRVPPPAATAAARAASSTGRAGPVRPACRPSAGRRQRRRRPPNTPAANSRIRVVEIVTDTLPTEIRPGAAEPDQHADERRSRAAGPPGSHVDEGEHPAAHVVADLAAQQRGAGQEGHARADPDQQHERTPRRTGARRTRGARRRSRPARSTARTSVVATARRSASGRRRCRWPARRRASRTGCRRSSRRRRAIARRTGRYRPPCRRPANAPRMPSTSPRTSGVLPDVRPAVDELPQQVGLLLPAVDCGR